MKTLAANKDLVFEKRNYNPLDRFFLSLIRDERDLPFIYLTLQITLIMIPLGVILYFPLFSGWIWWTIAIVYLLLNNFYFKGPFGLMLHCTSHRKFFKKEYDWANGFLPWVVGPFFGQTPGTYFSHHIGMHHAENNLEEDESSTMGYQRDSFKDFMKYFLDFFFLGLIRLTFYFKRKNRRKLLWKSVKGEAIFILACVGLCFINWQATLVVFILPFVISRFVMMLGNWTQHAFIDPSDPGNSYKNSITCINVRYNRRCWNDGYHINHHLKPAMHWSEYPLEFRRNLDQFAKNQAIVFDGIDYLVVFIALMQKRYDYLARNFVNINSSYQSEEEVVALLKARTRKFEV